MTAALEKAPERAGTAKLANSTGIAQVDATLRILADPSVTPDDRAAAYSVIHQVQLRLNRALRAVKDELIIHMEREGLRELGPLSVKATSIDVAWPCNAEGNWIDAQIQDAMALYAKVAPEYFRHVPEHWEVRTAELGAGVASGDPVARRLHTELKDKGWRTDQGKRLSLAVREPTTRKEQE